MPSRICVFVFVAVAGLLAAEDAVETRLRKAVVTKNLEECVATLAEMQKIGGTDRMKAIMNCLGAVPPGEDVLYWLLVRGATGFVDRAGLRALGDYVIRTQGDALARDLMFGMQGNHAPAAIEVHGIVLAKGAPDLARMAAEQLASIHSEASIEALIAGFKTQTSSGVRHAIGLALHLITGEGHGTDAELWASWYEGGKRDGLVRAADGKIVRAGDDIYRTAEREVLKESGRVLVLTAHKIIDETTPQEQKPQEIIDREHSLAFDRIEDIVSTAGIPCDVMDKTEFNKVMPDLDGYMAVAINCTQIKPFCVCPDCKPGSASTFRLFQCTGCDKHILKSFKLSREAVEHLANYVERGGYLFTEDWGLIEVLEPSWKKLVGSFPRLAEDKNGELLGAEKFLKEQDVDVNPVRGETSFPLMRGVYQFHREPPPVVEAAGEEESGDAGETISEWTPKVEPVSDLYHEWHIDDQSPAIDVRDPKNVRVLLTSQKLREVAEGHDACAITFFPGKDGKGIKSPVITDGDGSDYSPSSGRVLHILSHFGKQKNIADETAIRNLLFNFLRESAITWNRRHPPKPEKK